MELQLQGQTAVIVGGARGIGLAIAEEFAQEKANVALIDRETTTPGIARGLAERTGIRTDGLVCDVLNYGELQKTAAQIQQAFGRIDHLVFAVAIGSGKFGFPFWNLTPADWEQVLRVNVLGAANVLHAFAPNFVKAQSGTILLLASIAGQIGSQTDPPYSASKAALINFGQCAAKDFAPYNVRVNILCPGMVQTTLNRSVWEAWARQQPLEKRQSYEDWAGDKIKRAIPLGRWQEPQDIAALAVFLASERAKNITGQTMNVDGGFVMHW